MITEEKERRQLEDELEALINANNIDGEYSHFAMLETLGENGIDKIFWCSVFKKYVPTVDIKKIDFSFAAPPRTTGVMAIRSYLRVYESVLIHHKNPKFFALILISEELNFPQKT